MRLKFLLIKVDRQYLAAVQLIPVYLGYLHTVKRNIFFSKHMNVPSQYFALKQTWPLTPSWNPHWPPYDLSRHWHISFETCEPTFSWQLIWPRSLLTVVSITFSTSSINYSEALVDSVWMRSSLSILIGKMRPDAWLEISFHDSVSGLILSGQGSTNSSPSCVPPFDS